MRDRYLFSADRKASEYKHVLEITPGRARLLTPSGEAWGWRWVGSLGLFLGYAALTWPVGIATFSVAVLMGTVAAVVVGGALSVLWIVGLFFVFHVWDQKSLPLLADDPAQATNVILLGARSFGTFQEVRARTPGGDEFQLVVDGRSPRFWEAVGLLERKPA